MYICIYIYTYIHTCIYIYLYVDINIQLVIFVSFRVFRVASRVFEGLEGLVGLKVGG